MMPNGLRARGAPVGIVATPLRACRREDPFAEHGAQCTRARRRARMPKSFKKPSVSEGFQNRVPKNML
eukprot:1791574-Pyramimonas_sp.AAC.1